MHADACGFRGGRNAADAFEKRTATAATTTSAAATAWSARTRLADECQFGFHFSVLRKAEGHRHVEGAPARFESVCARTEASRHVVAVPDEVFGVVDDQAVSGRGGNLESPEHGTGKRIAHGACFSFARGHGPELVVGLDHQHAGAGAFELDDSRAGQDAAVEADVVRSQAGRQACRVKHLGVEPGDLEKQPASRLVPVEREEAVNLLHPGRSFFD